MPNPKWLDWALRIQGLSQNGLAFSKDPFDIERYEELRSIAAEIVAEHSDLKHPFINNLFEKEEGYATPKIEVRGAAFRDDACLMVREASDGGWCPPGGWAENRDSPAACVVREVREESGFIVKPTKLAAILNRLEHNHPPTLFNEHKIFFQCELIGGEARKSLETLDAGFFKENALPPLSASRITEGQIAMLFEHYRNPDRPTDFD